MQAGLAACAQVEAITSHYLWQGRLEHSAEWRVVFKTLPLAENALLEWVRARHSYEVPQLLTRQERAQPDYARWVAAQVRLQT